MGVSLFPAEFLALMESINVANLPYTVGLRHGTKTWEPGGTGSRIVWDGGDPTWTEPARVNAAGAPQEQLTAGSITDVKTFTVVTRKGVDVPLDGSPTSADYYRLEWTHDIAGLVSPFMLYAVKHIVHSYPTQTKFLATSVAPQ